VASSLALPSPPTSLSAFTPSAWPASPCTLLTSIPATELILYRLDTIGCSVISSCVVSEAHAELSLRMACTVSLHSSCRAAGGNCLQRLAGRERIHVPACS